MEVNTIHLGDCLDILKTLPDNSVSAIVTDPPYALGKITDIAGLIREWLNDGDGHDYQKDGFMGMSHWEKIPSPRYWREMFRVLKPGGHLLAFAGTRTQDLMGISIRLAGFELRDEIRHFHVDGQAAWVYGSGFPKSLDVSKAIDKIQPRNNLFEGFAQHYAKQRITKNLTHNQICEVGKFYKHHNHGGASVNWEKGHNVPTREQWGILQPLLELSEEWLPLIERVENERQLLDQKTVNKFKFEPGTLSQQKKLLYDISTPIFKISKQYDGWGTALKPSHEPILMFRKPLSEKNVAANVLKWGTGGLNIGATRVDAQNRPKREINKTQKNNGMFDLNSGMATGTTDAGRFTPNTLFTHSLFCSDTECAPECPVGELDRQSGVSESKANDRGKVEIFKKPNGWVGESTKRGHNDTGGASRFFPQFRYTPEDFLFLYTSKAATSERNKGLDHLPAKTKVYNGQSGDSSKEVKNVEERFTTEMQNIHPTVKNLSLMRWLCRLVTPLGGVVLDPFLGSGTTAIAAFLEGFNYIGIEREPEYYEIAKSRIEYHNPSSPLFGVLPLEA